MNSRDRDPSCAGSDIKLHAPLTNIIASKGYCNDSPVACLTDETVRRFHEREQQNLDCLLSSVDHGLAIGGSYSHALQVRRGRHGLDHGLPEGISIRQRKGTPFLGTLSNAKPFFMVESTQPAIYPHGSRPRTCYVRTV